MALLDKPGLVWTSVVDDHDADLDGWAAFAFEAEKHPRGPDGKFISRENITEQLIAKGSELGASGAAKVAAVNMAEAAIAEGTATAIAWNQAVAHLESLTPAKADFATPADYAAHAALKAKGTAEAMDPSWALTAGEAGKKQSFGAVLVDDTGRFLLREPSGHYGGYAWTFAKGGGHAGENPVDVAVREVEEETGHTPVLIGTVPGKFAGDTTLNRFFLAKSGGHDPSKMDEETASVKWATPEEAAALIGQTTSAKGKARDLALLAAAQEALATQGQPKAQSEPPETVAGPVVTPGGVQLHVVGGPKWAARAAAGWTTSETGTTGKLNLVAPDGEVAGQIYPDNKGGYKAVQAGGMHLGGSKKSQDAALEAVAAAHVSSGKKPGAQLGNQNAYKGGPTVAEPGGKISIEEAAAEQQALTDAMTPEDWAEIIAEDLGEDEDEKDLIYQVESVHKEFAKWEVNQAAGWTLSGFGTMELKNPSGAVVGVISSASGKWLIVSGPGQGPKSYPSWSATTNAMIAAYKAAGPVATQGGDLGEGPYGTWPTAENVPVAESVAEAGLSDPEDGTHLHPDAKPSAAVGPASNPYGWVFKKGSQWAALAPDGSSKNFSSAKKAGAYLGTKAGADAAAEVSSGKAPGGQPGNQNAYKGGSAQQEKDRWAARNDAGWTAVKHPGNSNRHDVKAPGGELVGRAEYNDDTGYFQAYDSNGTLLGDDYATRATALNAVATVYSNKKPGAQPGNQNAYKGGAAWQENDKWNGLEATGWDSVQDTSNTHRYNIKAPGGQPVGRIEYRDADGHYSAYDVNSVFLGNYDIRARAQNAVVAAHNSKNALEGALGAAGWTKGEGILGGSKVVAPNGEVAGSVWLDGNGNWAAVDAAGKEIGGHKKSQEAALKAVADASGYAAALKSGKKPGAQPGNKNAYKGGPTALESDKWWSAVSAGWSLEGEGTMTVKDPTGATVGLVSNADGRWKGYYTATAGPIQDLGVQPHWSTAANAVKAAHEEQGGTMGVAHGAEADPDAKEAAIAQWGVLKDQGWSLEATIGGIVAGMATVTAPNGSAAGYVKPSASVGAWDAVNTMNQPISTHTKKGWAVLAVVKDWQENKAAADQLAEEVSISHPAHPPLMAPVQATGAIADAWAAHRAALVAKGLPPGEPGLPGLHKAAIDSELEAAIGQSDISGTTPTTQGGSWANPAEWQPGGTWSNHLVPKLVALGVDPNTATESVTNYHNLHGAGTAAVGGDPAVAWGKQLAAGWSAQTNGIGSSAEVYPPGGGMSVGYAVKQTDGTWAAVGTTTGVGVDLGNHATKEGALAAIVTGKKPGAQPGNKNAYKGESLEREGKKWAKNEGKGFWFENSPLPDGTPSKSVKDPGEADIGRIVSGDGDNWHALGPDGAALGTYDSRFGALNAVVHAAAQPASGKAPGAQPGNKNAWKGGPHDIPGMSDHEHAAIEVLKGGPLAYSEVQAAWPSDMDKTYAAQALHSLEGRDLAEQSQDGTWHLTTIPTPAASGDLDQPAPVTTAGGYVAEPSEFYPGTHNVKDPVGLTIGSLTIGPSGYKAMTGTKSLGYYDSMDKALAAVETAHKGASTTYQPGTYNEEATKWHGLTDNGWATEFVDSKTFKVLAPGGVHAGTSLEDDDGNFAAHGPNGESLGTFLYHVDAVNAVAEAYSGKKPGAQLGNQNAYKGGPSGDELHKWVQQHVAAGWDHAYSMLNGEEVDNVYSPAGIKGGYIKEETVDGNNIHTATAPDGTALGSFDNHYAAMNAIVQYHKDVGYESLSDKGPIALGSGMEGMVEEGSDDIRVMHEDHGHVGWLSPGASGTWKAIGKDGMLLVAGLDREEAAKALLNDAVTGAGTAEADAAEAADAAADAAAPPHYQEASEGNGHIEAAKWKEREDAGWTTVVSGMGSEATIQEPGGMVVGSAVMDIEGYWTAKGADGGTIGTYLYHTAALNAVAHAHDGGIGKKPGAQPGNQNADAKWAIATVDGWGTSVFDDDGNMEVYAPNGETVGKIQLSDTVDATVLGEDGLSHDIGQFGTITDAKNAIVSYHSGKKPGAQPGNKNAYKGGPDLEEQAKWEAHVDEENWQESYGAGEELLLTSPEGDTAGTVHENEDTGNFDATAVDGAYLGEYMTSAAAKNAVAHYHEQTQSGPGPAIHPDAIWGGHVSAGWGYHAEGDEIHITSPTGITVGVLSEGPHGLIMAQVVNGPDLGAFDNSAEARNAIVAHHSGKAPGAQPGNQNAYKNGPADEEAVKWQAGPGGSSWYIDSEGSVYTGANMFAGRVEETADGWKAYKAHGGEVGTYATKLGAYNAVAWSAGYPYPGQYEESYTEATAGDVGDLDVAAPSVAAPAAADLTAAIAAIGPTGPVKPAAPLPSLGTLPKPATTTELKAKVMELVDQGYSSADVATALGVKQTYVSDHASRTRAQRKKDVAALQAGAAAAPAAPATPATPVKPYVATGPVPAGFPAEPHKLEFVKALGGSTGAKQYRDAEGGLWVLKKGKYADHVKSESDADAAYAAAGIDVPEHHLYDTAEGPLKVARWVEGVELGKWAAKATPAQKAELVARLQRGFAMDALMGNWDVTGASADNVKVDATGRPWRIDNGGSMDHRAQGEKKEPEQWNEHPTELWTLDDPSKKTAEWLGAPSHDTKVAQMKDLLTRRASILASIQDPGRRGVVAGRLDSMARVVKASDAMKADNFSQKHRGEFARHQVGMAAHGAFGMLPKKLVPQGGPKSVTLINPENGVAFDGMRAAGYTPVKHYTVNLVEGSHGQGQKWKEQVLVNGAVVGTVEKVSSGVYKATDSKGEVTRFTTGSAATTAIAEPYKGAAAVAAGGSKFKSMTDGVYDYIKQQGGNPEIIKQWTESQGGGSQSGHSLAVKYYLATQNSSDLQGDYYWTSGLASSKAEYEKKVQKYGADVFRKTIEAYHAATYELLSRVDLPHLDRAAGTIEVMRSERKAVDNAMQKAGIPQLPPSGPNKVVKDLNILSGPLESFSLMKRVFTGDKYNWRMKVPLHRIFGTYLTERDPGHGNSPFLGDTENEIMVMTDKNIKAEATLNKNSAW